MCKAAKQTRQLLKTIFISLPKSYRRFNYSRQKYSLVESALLQTLRLIYNLLHPTSEFANFQLHLSSEFVILIYLLF